MTLWRLHLYHPFKSEAFIYGAGHAEAALLVNEVPLPPEDLGKRSQGCL